MSVERNKRFKKSKKENSEVGCSSKCVDGREGKKCGKNEREERRGVKDVCVCGRSGKGREGNVERRKG